jgi:Protein of unknown function (DUF3675)
MTITNDDGDDDASTIFSVSGEHMFYHLISFFFQFLWIMFMESSYPFSFTGVQLFLLRAAGFLLPCYIMAWAISILQRRRQRQVPLLNNCCFNMC